MLVFSRYKNHSQSLHLTNVYVQTEGLVELSKRILCYQEIAPFDWAGKDFSATRPERRLESILGIRNTHGVTENKSKAMERPDILLARFLGSSIQVGEQVSNVFCNSFNLELTIRNVEMNEFKVLHGNTVSVPKALHFLVHS